MNINEIKTLAEVGVTEIKAGCYKVSAKSGYKLRIGEDKTYTDGDGNEQTEPATVTDCIYIGETGEVELAVVEDTDAGIDTADLTEEDTAASLTLEQRVTALEGRVGALEADAASGADGGAAMAIDDDL